ncbi:hypothetical protein J2847_004212 [Azospirillum agricola]|uniref:hypothetical protein n=1 Tax=Azospirillum agricola TaxID=1720247 RepID=UPI001AEAFE4C|nr:hypothetical protein [Azospirillum agricola]MBP2230903.1 hypothetical protein [Azospirillum agricola]
MVRIALTTPDEPPTEMNMNSFSFLSRASLNVKTFVRLAINPFGQRGGIMKVNANSTKPEGQEKPTAGRRHSRQRHGTQAAFVARLSGVAI